MTGIADCCARTWRGHAIVAQPTIAMHSRRFMSILKLRNTS